MYPPKGLFSIDYEPLDFTPVDSLYIFLCNLLSSFNSVLVRFGHGDMVTAVSFACESLGAEMQGFL